MHAAHADLTDEVTRELKSVGVSGGMARAYQDLENVSQCSVVVGGQLLPGSDFDARLAIAARLTANLRAKVFEKLQYTVSAGSPLPTTPFYVLWLHAQLGRLVAGI